MKGVTEFMKKDLLDPYNLRVTVVPRSWPSFFKKEYQLVINEILFPKSKDKIPLRNELWFKKDNLLNNRGESPF